MSDYERIINMLLNSEKVYKSDWGHSFSGENYIIEFYQNDDYYNTVFVFDKEGKFLWFE